MAMHDWTRVDAGICHAFHHGLPAESPLSVFAYECNDRVRTYLEPLAVGDSLPDMPVFLYPGMYIDVPLETTYLAAWEAVPRR